MVHRRRDVLGEPGEPGNDVTAPVQAAE
jgi:hypothetical protein